MIKNAISILFEDENIVAVNKPSGLLTVPDRFDQQLPSLKNRLRDQYGSIFVIHRLDRDTSGLLIFAKNELAHQFYSMAFEQRHVEKKYLGIVHGFFGTPEGTINKPIAPHFNIKGKMMVDKTGKASVTHFKMIEKLGAYSFASFSIETGRTHQIRVHLQDHGNPIVCDELYSNNEPIYLSKIKRKFNLSKNELEERPLLNRLALHSAQLSFTNQEGKTCLIEAPLPKDLQATLQQLRKNT